MPAILAFIQGLLPLLGSLLGQIPLNSGQKAFTDSFLALIPNLTKDLGDLGPALTDIVERVQSVIQHRSDPSIEDWAKMNELTAALLARADAVEQGDLDPGTGATGGNDSAPETGTGETDGTDQGDPANKT